MTARTPVLLCDASYYGTLAAARALGRSGVRVTAADPSRASPALWSRYVARRIRAPRHSEFHVFTAWLLRFGDTEPRHVVYPTSDDVSFALAANDAEVRKRFLLYQPPLEALMQVLDKGLLVDHARAVGLDVPETWLPETEADVERIARGSTAQLMVKPRTQVLLRTHAKGAVGDAETGGVVGAYRDFIANHRHDDALAKRFPDATRPLIQRFHPEAADGIYSLSGFRDHTGAHFVALAATKVLQRPRRLGIGLAFEGAPVDPALAAGVERLFDRIGYYGVFEAEFIRAGGQSLLIDMNARFYGQLAFDVARGLPLPQLAYAGAIGDDVEVGRLVREIPESSGSHAFCNRFGLEVLVGAQRLAGVISSDEARRWRVWCASHGENLVDAVADSDDPKPLAFEIAQHLYGYVRHPRAFYRMVAVDL
jgi:D-aspartate ligase